ncbi:hypothetical protein KFK09_018923 [Dendrobium nobile]|uniref:Cyclin n=1 Tax=Dendrobium nobile TaxID=94219 RepID=A0A8T3AX53_DENNO|nr:hypothetical protein KFK09_018923 [Dendrobium nobile]
MVQTLAEAEQKKNIPLVINILSTLLKRTTNQNDELTVSQQYRRHPPQAAKAFSGLVIPTISIRRYIKHIYFNTDFSTCCYVIAFIYLDRFLYFNPSVRLDFFNVHRFFITAILTSVKFMDERCNGNAHFAYVGGISVSEMKELEVDFLFGLRFNLNVNPISYNGYCSFLLREMSRLKLKDPCKLQFLSSEEENSD